MILVSNAKVIKQYCEGLSGSMARLGIENKPCQMFVTKLAGLEKKKSRQVFGLKYKPAYQQSLFSTRAYNWTSLHLCSWDNSSFHYYFWAISSAYSMFLVSGCMGSRSLAIWNPFFKWFRDTFIPHCGSARPVQMLLDNHYYRYLGYTAGKGQQNRNSWISCSHHSYFTVFRCVN